MITPHEDTVEVMARRCMPDHEWDMQTFGYIKIQRRIAEEMLDALMEAGYTIVAPLP